MARTYGFIGCGNMGGALARALAKTVDGSSILLANRTAAKAEALAAEIGATVATANEIAASCDVIVMGVKPQQLAEVFEGIRGELAARESRFVIVTMAAGTSMARIRELAGAYPIIRIMPNLNAQIGQGTTLICSDGATDEEFQGFMDDMAASGSFVVVDEADIDAGSAISGCGPAFVALFADALADGGVEAGLSRDVALDLALQTIQGTAALLLETGQNPGDLAVAVCSPGGTTIEGVHALEDGAFHDTAASAVTAAYKRALEL